MKRSIGAAMVWAAIGVVQGLTFVWEAGAGTNGFVVPPFRGVGTSAAAYWETFSLAVGEPGNRPDRAGATANAWLIQTETNAFLTGSGNVYNLAGTSEFVLRGEASGPVQTVVLQTRTLGGELDYGSAILIGQNGSGPETNRATLVVELNRGQQPGLGATVSMLWQWVLPESGVSNYTIQFKAAGPSVSFDSLTLDTSSASAPLWSVPFQVIDTAPDLERWMYPQNAAPCDRPAGAVFATFGDEAGVDTRHAQHLLRWNTAASIPPQQGPGRYWVRRCRVSVTVNRGNLFVYDPTHDDFRTYFEADHPARRADEDGGRPVELFGVGYRNGYRAATFDQCAPFGGSGPGQRNAYAAAWSPAGVWIDISNHVGKTNEAFPRFEAVPFGCGRTTNAVPGQLVPPGAVMTFDLDLTIPEVLEYVQTALDEGQLSVALSSLHASAGQFGAPSYPDFVTRFNEAAVTPTRLELEGVVLGGGDLDRDGLADDWELARLGTLTYGPGDDVDGDGAGNTAEFAAGTDPRSASSVLRVEVRAGATGQVTVRVPAQADRRYRLESTEDLVRWQAVTNAPTYEPGAGYIGWSDVAEVGPRRFYRAIVGVTNP